MNAQARETLTAINGKRLLVTGGGGYVGNRIVLELLKLKASNVIVIDVRPPNPDSIPAELKQVYDQRVVMKKVDLCNSNEVWPLLEGVDMVIHTASFGMSGRDMLNKKKVRAINVGGTQSLLEGCATHGVAGFVYTSSANVVFSGKYAMPDPGEDVPYNKEEDCVDEYSKTKCLAEQIVVKFNGMALKKQNSATKYTSIATCAVRPAGIYGEGEERHFPRIISIMESGMMVFNVGSPDTLVDWVHVDNLVYGHVLAAAKLLSANLSDRQLVGGKSYYISDKKPINQFAFLRPLVEGLGHKVPNLWIPFKVMFTLAFIIEMLHKIISPIIPFEPFMNRAEVCKIGVTHYFRTDKAERELGWSLVISPEAGINKMVKYFQEKQHIKEQNKPKVKPGNSKFLLIIFLVLGLAITWEYLRRI